MDYIRIKTWAEYQHYKDRSAPWIKLHKEILSSHFWVMGNDASKLLAICLMLLAQRTDNKIPADIEYIKRFGSLQETPDFQPLINSDLIEFIDENGCLNDASKVIATCYTEERENRIDTMSGKPDSSKKKTFLEEAKLILDYLNQVVGTKYQPVKANLDLIASRLRDGSTVEIMKAVIDKQNREWTGDMRTYLRPATLFNATKFASYSGSICVESKQDGVKREEDMTQSEKDEALRKFMERMR